MKKKWETHVVINNCTTKELGCPFLWKSLNATGDSSVRECSICGCDVHFCLSAAEAECQIRLCNRVAFEEKRIYTKMRIPKPRAYLGSHQWTTCHLCNSIISGRTGVALNPKITARLGLQSSIANLHFGCFLNWSKRANYSELVFGDFVDQKHPFHHEILVSDEIAVFARFDTYFDEVLFSTCKSVNSWRMTFESFFKLYDSLNDRIDAPKDLSDDGLQQQFNHEVLKRYLPEVKKLIPNKYAIIQRIQNQR